MITWVSPSLDSLLMLATSANICAQSASTIGTLTTAIIPLRDSSTRLPRSRRSRPTTLPRDPSVLVFLLVQSMRPALTSSRLAPQETTTSTLPWQSALALSLPRPTSRRTSSNSAPSDGNSSWRTASRLSRQALRRLNFLSTTSVSESSAAIRSSATSSPKSSEPILLKSTRLWRSLEQLQIDIKSVMLN